MSQSLFPNVTDVEKIVVGAILVDSNARTDVLGILSPQSFFEARNGAIFEAVQNLSDDGKPVDLLTVTEYLKAKKQLESVGGVEYMMELTSRIGSTANVEHHARIVHQYAIRREMIMAGGEISRRAHDESVDVFELIDGVEQRIEAIGNTIMSTDVHSIHDVADAASREYIAKQSKQGMTGTATDSEKLDWRIGGLNPPDLILLAARPGMGKTAKALNIARRSAEHGTPVGFFSLEMSETQLVNRLICSHGSIDINSIIRGEMNVDQFSQLAMPSVTALSRLPIYFVDKGGLSIREFKMRARRLVKEQKVGLIIIDYLQLMTGDTNRNNNREQEISYISRNIKLTAKELNVPIIALSQLSRAVETRGGDRRPMLSDLRESGSLEQDADLVMFLYRPEYYGIMTDGDGNSTENMIETIIAKFRNGNTGSIFEPCALRYMQTGEYAKAKEQQPLDWMPHANDNDAPF